MRKETGIKPHAVRNAGSIAFQYDANGNMTQRYDGGTSVTLDLVWNHDNKPSVISRRVGGGASQPYLTFTYDGRSQRVKKYNHFTGATTLYFGEVCEIRNEEPIIHLFANTQRIASIHEDGRMQYYHGNHLHSASVVTDGYGNTKETIEYHPYGTYRLRTDLDASFPNVNYTFTDQEDDDEAGLYNYKARLYDPLLGRFISADSIVPEPGNLQAYNRYSYCLNNPVVYTDPSGQFSLGDVFNAFITGVVAAVVFWATGGTGTPGITTFIAGITAGAAGGATASALSGGNLQGILQGAVMGAAIGGLTGGLYNAGVPGSVLLAAGAGTAAATNGLDGLAYYAAGMLGAMAGGYGAQYVKENWNSWTTDMNNTGGSATNTSWQQNEKKVNLQLAVNQNETIKIDTNVITCTERTTWDYIKEWLITPMGGKVEGAPKVSGVGPCGCEWVRTGFAEDCYAGGKYLFSRPVNTIFTTGKTAITVGGASGHGCICPNPNGELQPWTRNHYGSH